MVIPTSTTATSHPNLSPVFGRTAPLTVGASVIRMVGASVNRSTGTIVSGAGVGCATDSLKVALHSLVEKVLQETAEKSKVNSHSMSCPLSLPKLSVNSPAPATANTGAYPTN